jgi:hypothetical protein
MINPVSAYHAAVDLNQNSVTSEKTQIPTPVSASTNQDQVTISSGSQSSVQLPVYQAGKTDSPLGNGLSKEPEAAQAGDNAGHDCDNH